MKIITPIVLASVALALCGCATDSPVISTPASQSNQANSDEAVRGTGTANANDNNAAGPSAAEETRDIANQRNSAGTLQGGGGNVPADPNQSGASQMQSMNPYGH